MITVCFTASKTSRQFFIRDMERNMSAVIGLFRTCANNCPRRCVTEREGPELDYTVLGISSGKRASNNRQIVKIIYQFNL